MIILFHSLISFRTSTGRTSTWVLKFLPVTHFDYIIWYSKRLLMLLKYRQLYEGNTSFSESGDTPFNSGDMKVWMEEG